MVYLLRLPLTGSNKPNTNRKEFFNKNDYFYSLNYQ